MVRHALFDRRLTRMRILREERRCPDEHAARAVAALHRVLVDERLLHRMEAVPLRETFHRRDLESLHRGLVHCHEARRPLSTSGDDEAGAALPDAAAVARAGEPEVVAQRPQQWDVRGDV